MLPARAVDEGGRRGLTVFEELRFTDGPDILRPSRLFPKRGRSPMDPLDIAIKRLAKAVDRLETAVDLRDQRLDKERSTLTQALQAARSDRAHTAAAAEGVSARLEGAIERLNAVLER